MTWFYNSFRPLMSRPAGIEAAARFGLPRFIDGSCRREPDFQSSFPSISGLCRKNKFAPRLYVGDAAIYVTTKGDWGGWEDRHRRLVAVLGVCEKFANHEEAAEWYRELGLPLPSNCWVEGNPPVPYEQTVQDAPELTWDRDYRARARRYPTFLATEALYCNVADPPVITSQMLVEAFGREPGAQNPPAISESAGMRLIEMAGVALRSTARSPRGADSRWDRIGRTQ